MPKGCILAINPYLTHHSAAYPDAVCFNPKRGALALREPGVIPPSVAGKQNIVKL